MMKLAISLILACLSTTAVYAEIYNYACKVAGKVCPLRVDDNNNVLEWRGRDITYPSQVPTSLMVVRNMVGRPRVMERRLHSAL